MDIRIEPSWKAALKDEFTKPYFEQLTAEVKADYLIADPSIYPPAKLIFNAFDQCPFNTTKVVILGQDPYHGPGQAMGLAFSVPDGFKVPPSLRNIHQEIRDDIGTDILENGNLEHWAKQGVLLLNATLTVEHGKAGSHQGRGWERFTDSVMERISDDKDHVVFLLWGAFAGAKAALIDESKHLVLKAPHPSPLSAHRGFFGCKHFSRTNAFLIKHGMQPIDW